MNLPQLLGANLVVVLALMIGTWVVSVKRRDTSIVDIVWGPGFVAVAVVTVIAAPNPTLRAWLCLTLTAVWGLRLSFHIARRNRGRGEDPRYAAWRAEHGERWALRSLVTVFGLQAVLMWIVSLPIQVTIAGPNTTGPTAWDVIGLALWSIGLTVEAVADAQLARFRGRHGGGGGLLTTGLWRYSRHPNYFGEAVLWWGFYALAVVQPGGWMTVVSPLLITVLVRWVSGVPMAEKQLDGRKRVDAYRACTSVFIPLPPRQADSTGS